MNANALTHTLFRHLAYVSTKASTIPTSLFSGSPQYSQTITATLP